MKNILVPTDFSHTASNALNYAIGLAKKQHAEIILLHAYHLNFTTTEDNHHTPKPGESPEAYTDRQLKQLKLKVETSGIKCHNINKQAFAVDLIIDTANEKKPEMIVMGTKGASGIKEITTGSLTGRIIEKACCPVIAIPDQSVYGPINDIAYASGFHESDLTAMKTLVKLGKTYDASITVLHVLDKKTSDSEEEHEKLHKFRNKLMKELKYDQLFFKMLYGDSPAEVLENYIDKNNPDLMAMSMEQRTFFDKLLGRSTTKQMAYHVKIPLLTFHFTQHSVLLI